MRKITEIKNFMEFSHRDTNKDKILKLLKQEGKELARKEVCEKTGIPHKNISREINELMRLGMIEKRKHGKFVSYIVIEQPEQEPWEKAEPKLMPSWYEEKRTRRDKLLEILQKEGKISRARLIQEYGFSNAHLTTVIRQLIEEGRIKKTKRKGKVYYSLPDVPFKEIEESSLTETEVQLRQIKPLEEFLKYTKYMRKRSQNTIDNYAYSILRFYKFKNTKSVAFKPIAVGKITEKTILDFIIYLTDVRKNSDRTQITILAALSSYFQFCEEKGYITKNPMKGYKFPRVHKKPQVDFDIDEFHQMVEATTNYRDKVLLYFMLFGGMRRGEIQKANVKDIHWDKNEIIVWQETKSKKFRTVELEPFVIEMLKNYLKERPKPLDADEKAIFLTHFGTRLMFASIGTIIRNIRKNAGIEKHISCHSFRRACARLLYERGFPLVAIQEILGHEDINTTRGYVKAEEKFVKREYSKASKKLIEDIINYPVIKANGGTPNAPTEVEPLRIWTD